MAFWTLYKRELSSYFQSTIAHVVLFGSALAQGLSFFTLMTYISESNYKENSVMQVFFTWPILWFFFLIQVPLITMRTFSEEFKLGTIEMLLTAPVREWDIVLAKFFGALTFFLSLWLPIVLDLLALQLFSNPPPPVYWSQIAMTAMTITLMSSFYISLGVFSSVLTKNQIVAAVLCFATMAAFFFISLWRWFQHVDSFKLACISYISGQEHLQNAVLGIFDTRPLAFYVSMSLFVLLLTKTILEARRLRS